MELDFFVLDVVLRGVLPRLRYYLSFFFVLLLLLSICILFKKNFLKLFYKFFCFFLCLLLRHHLIQVELATRIFSFHPSISLTIFLFTPRSLPNNSYPLFLCPTPSSITDFLNIRIMCGGVPSSINRSRCPLMYAKLYCYFSMRIIFTGFFYE